MTPQKFDEITKVVFDTCSSILNKRRSIYSSGGDRLGNFKRAAQMTEGQTPSQALIGMLKKQFVSILDYVDGTVPMKLENIEEKIYDSINYHVLLLAIAIEEDEKRWKSGITTSEGYVSELGQTQVATPDKSEPSLFEIGRLSRLDTTDLPEESPTVEQKD